jgi:putative hydrolase of the HAD superfamily
MPYRAILFDLDDTLYDYRAYWDEKLRYALGKIVERYPHLSLDALVAAAIAGTIYGEQLPAWLAGYGVRDADLIAAAQERYRANWWEQLQLFAQAPAVLQQLRRTHRLGLITNGPARTQRPKIAQFGLGELMDVIVVSGEVGVAKPDPAIFHLALDQLGVSAAQALFVGDSLVYDLAGAHAAGVAFVWMNPRREPLPPELPRPQAIIASLAELPTLIAGPRP